MISSAPALNGIVSVLPEILLLVFACHSFLREGGGERQRFLAGPAFLALFSTLLLIPFYWGRNISGFGGLILRDNFSLLLQLVALLCLFLVILYSHEYLQREKRHGAEYYGFILIAAIGMNIMMAATDLMVVFLGMEIMSLSLYVLVGFCKQVKEGMEAALKYFLLGAFSSAVFLFGIALIYGVSGGTGISGVGIFDSSIGGGLPLLFTAAALLFVGIGFKIAAVPFHMWAPDVYEGAPVSIASLLAVAPKIAAFAVFIRVGTELAGYALGMVGGLVIVMAVASMVLGNFAALRQDGLVRMLAYSGIAQAGYMLIAFYALPEGSSALIFYLCVYALMNMGAFGVAVHLSRGNEGILRLKDMAGLGSRSPFLALAMAVFMLSLTGIPPTGGFFAKFYVFKFGLEAGHLGTVIVAVLMSVVSAYYYLRVIVYMYMGEDSDFLPPASASPVNVFTVVIAVLAGSTILMGVLPGFFLEVALSCFSGGRV
ncbi:MAG: NADH-quinone oxidoreductase subunit N [Syntrophales bacterium]|jgi:NADH-quinone oxidoreductase subunit N|nr:NADH-quinone oxidoreductase subunit N [Syntrophales bacterium]MCK9527239.1 NADH-quinone oxidoreductase subunit N [Syntrophales bacterium]MDX9921291.1 NADH-quinone oxidoreductase subunit N [Syntrophales bacterium]